MSQLGTLEELPLDYRKEMAAASTAPLWPIMRNVLPHDAPRPDTKATLGLTSASGLCYYAPGN
jgi:gentisate 1,2-dioxygenase